jgi:hypothetical protein
MVCFFFFFVFFGLQFFFLHILLTLSYSDPYLSPLSLSPPPTATQPHPKSLIVTYAFLKALNNMGFNSQQANNKHGQLVTYWGCNILEVKPENESNT